MKNMQRYYYVDEAGDSTLFDSKGRIIVGQPGCSSFFILGLLQIDNPSALDSSLRELHHQVIADPYFANVPSFDPKSKKTAVFFHAKDDLPEVRHKVMELLRNCKGLHFYCIVLEKKKTIQYVRQKNIKDASYHYHPNEMYDVLVKRLFRDRLHIANQNFIYFAKRGKSDRTQALREALDQARQRFFRKYKKTSSSTFELNIDIPARQYGLQAVDYFLWSVQRLYERGEDRYIQYLWESVSFVQDIDDTRSHNYGMYYDKKHPLTITALEGRK